MNGLPPIGTIGEERFVVEANYAIEIAPGIPLVLSTPWLIWFLEQAALNTVSPWLDPNEGTVGVEIEIRHLAPTPLGHSVTCVARVIFAEGPRMTFQIEARDEIECIARGVHKRQVVPLQAFSKRVQSRTKWF